MTDEEIARIADTYHRWRGTLEGEYADVPGFCKSATKEAIAASDFVLTPGRYCGSEQIEDEGEEFAVKFAKLRATLDDQFTKSQTLQSEIILNLQKVSIE